MGQQSENILGPYGPHFHADIELADFDALSDLDTCRTFLSELPAKIGMTKITEPVVFWYTDSDDIKMFGITGMVIIAESHISIHTYPYKRYAFIDVFSCKPFDIELVKTEMKVTFKPEITHCPVIQRGVNFHKY